MDLALKSARIVDLCGKSSGFADFENTVDRGSWIVDRGSAVIFDADSGLCLSYVRILSPVNEIWITDLSSALVGMLFCHQACRLLYYLGEINSGVHMYQFTFEPLHFCFRMWLWFRISADRRIWRKKGTDRWICIPLLTPLAKASAVDFFEAEHPKRTQNHVLTPIKVQQTPPVLFIIRELKQTTTATPTGTSPNKRFDEQKNSCAFRCHSPRNNIMKRPSFA